MKLRLSKRHVVIILAINVALVCTLSFIGNSCSRGFKIPGSETLGSSQRIESVNPPFVYPAGGATLTITGHNMGNIEQVLIGGADCTDVVVVDEDTVSCIAPPVDIGDLEITLIDPDFEETWSGLLIGKDFERVESVAGRSGLTGRVDGVGTLARFGELEAATLVGDDLYLADRYYHEIIKLNTATKEVTLVAGYSTGRTSTNELVNGPGATARFDFPDGLVSDGTFLYISDANNHVIRKMNLATKDVTTFAGTPNTSGFTDGVGTAAAFYFPGAMAIIGRTLYVADEYNYAIRKVDLDTAAVTTLIGGPPQMPDGNEDKWAPANLVTLATAVESAHPYADNLSQLFPVINQPNAKVFRVHFTNFDVESGADFLQFLNAAGAPVSVPDFYGDPATGLSGYYPNQGKWSRNMTLDALRMKLVSDATNTGDGFRIDQYLWSDSDRLSHLDDLPGQTHIGDITSMYALGNTLYFTDSTDATVRKIDVVTKVVTTIAGSGSSTPSYVRGAGYETYMEPRGITVGADYITVLDSRTFGAGFSLFDSVLRVDKENGVTTELVTTDSSKGEAESDTDGDLEPATIMNPKALVYHPNRGMYLISPTVVRVIK